MGLRGGSRKGTPLATPVATPVATPLTTPLARSPVLFGATGRPIWGNLLGPCWVVFPKFPDPQTPTLNTPTGHTLGRPPLPCYTIGLAPGGSACKPPRRLVALQPHMQFSIINSIASGRPHERAQHCCVSLRHLTIFMYFHDLVCFVSFERFRKAFCSGERNQLQLHLAMHLDVHMACL